MPQIPDYIGVGYGGAGTKSFNFIEDDRENIGSTLGG